MGTHPIFESDFDCLTDFGLMQRVITRTLSENANFIQKEFARINISGIWPPIPTPFLPTKESLNNGIDYSALKENIAKWSQFGFKGLTVQGSNGSYPYLLTSERIELIEIVKECIDELDSDNRLMLMAGAGAESTIETKNICEAMSLAGADCLLVVTPSFYKNAMTNAALIKHFTEVADASEKPIVIYNVPANTGLDMPAEAIAELADHPNICGVKDSGGDIAKIGQILFLTEGKRFQVLAGSASFLYAAVSLGASGGVCALANVLGKEVVDLYEATVNGEHKRAVALQKRLIGPNQAVTKQFGVPGLKAAMDQYGYNSAHLRAPLQNASPAVVETVKKIFRQSQFLN